MGGETFKLKYGHRGMNQPVKDVTRDRVFITSQNHGYAVVPESIPAEVGNVTHFNLNDGTCEGVQYPDIHAFTVQFHPEASAGPNDTGYLFEQFTDLMERGQQGCL
jgi:carbamoyl-phosphate synthase small subunit